MALGGKNVDRQNLVGGGQHDKKVGGGDSFGDIRGRRGNGANPRGRKKIKLNSLQKKLRSKMFVPRNERKEKGVGFHKKIQKGTSPKKQTANRTAVWDEEIGKGNKGRA